MQIRLPTTSPTPTVLTERMQQLFDRLAADAAPFDFYYVLRVVDAAVDGAALGRALQPKDEPLRLTQHVSLAFPPSALHRYQPGVAAAGRGRLYVNHFGLFGANGALPQHLTEYVQERVIHHKDETMARFCDIFQHRMILLFYRAWADCQAVTSHDRPDRDHFGRYAASLVGLGQPSLRDRDHVPDSLKLHHAGHLSRMARNPEGLAKPLQALLRVPVTVQEYVMQWLHLEPEDRTRLVSTFLAGSHAGRRLELGRSASRLGLGAVAGERIPDVQHKFRLVLGPMPLQEFERYLPGRTRFKQVRDWVRNFLGVELAWDARIVLRREEVPAVRLGAYGQLGWTSWLGMPQGRRQKDADELLLDVERLTPASQHLWKPPLQETPHV